ncbi:MAG: hypothetical protein HXY45_23085 [Syntrophaceae bacterium]|nr:hypothetical protein [Syntrophaceae bacterium]
MDRNPVLGSISPRSRAFSGSFRQEIFWVLKIKAGLSGNRPVISFKAFPNLFFVQGSTFTSCRSRDGFQTRADRRALTGIFIMNKCTSYQDAL